MGGDGKLRISEADLQELESVGQELARLKERRNFVSRSIESKSARRWRTADLVVSVVLTGGSFFAAAITPWTLIAAPVGFARLIRTVVKDSARENAHVDAPGVGQAQTRGHKG